MARSLGIITLAAALGSCVPPLTAPSDKALSDQGPSDAVIAPASPGQTSPPASGSMAMETDPTPTAEPTPAAIASPQPLPNAGNEVGNAYQFALNKAYSAAKLSQSARAMSDWEFVVSRWQEAINLLQTIEKTDPRAPKKIAEYRKNLAYAQRRATQVPPPPKPIRVQSAPARIAASGGQRPGAAPTVSSAPGTAPRSPTAGEAGETAAGASQTGSGVTKVPIRRRFGGIPIIVVQINGQGFPMMVDTGASTTVVTQAMANVLGLQPVGSVRANTPSQQGVVFQVTRLERLQVGDLEARNLNAAIAPSMDVGLLGQNFFGAYEVTISREEVIFRRPG